MYIPADQVTKFGVFNHNTAIEISNYTVTVGKKAAIEAINGLDLALDSNGMALPMDGDWTLEGRLVIDNYSIDECGELDNFEFERIEDET